MIARHWWASAYLILPQLFGANLDAIYAAVKHANESAPGGREDWTGLLVVEPDATSVLVMSRRPDQQGPGYRHLEGVLRGLRAPFILTEPLAIPYGPERSLN